MNYILAVWCLFLHFVSDFIFQSRDVAKNKSSDFKYLKYHLQELGITFTIGLLFFLGIWKTLIFVILNTAIHGMIDWNIWRFYKSQRKNENPETFKYWEDKLFYIIIGFDQFLHGLTILLILWAIK